MDVPGTSLPLPAAYGSPTTVLAWADVEPRLAGSPVYWLVTTRADGRPHAVPVDAVSSSASGIDPGISPAYAALQVPRVARVTGLSGDEVRALVADATTGRGLGFLGEPVVNATELNLAVAAARG